MDRFNGLSYALRPSRVSFILSQRFGYVGIESLHGQIETLIYFGDDGRASGIALRRWPRQSSLLTQGSSSGESRPNSPAWRGAPSQFTNLK
jgi:hypothetical protein